MPSSGFTDIVSRDGTGPTVSTEDDEQQPDPPLLSEAERAAAFRRPEPKIPPKFALIVVAVLVGLGMGGTLLEHLLSSVGLNPDASHAGPGHGHDVGAGPHRSPRLGTVDAAGGCSPGASSWGSAHARGPPRGSRSRTRPDTPHRSPTSAATPWS